VLLPTTRALAKRDHAATHVIASMARAAVASIKAAKADVADAQIPQIEAGVEAAV